MWNESTIPQYYFGDNTTRERPGKVNYLFVTMVLCQEYFDKIIIQKHTESEITFHFK